MYERRPHWKGSRIAREKTGDTYLMLYNGVYPVLYPSKAVSLALLCWSVERPEYFGVPRLKFHFLIWMKLRSARKSRFVRCFALEELLKH